MSSLPSQLPTPPQPTSPPPHPSLQHLSHSPSPPPQFTMSQPPPGLPPPSQNPPFLDPHTRTLTNDITRGSHTHDGDVGTDPEVTRLGTQLDTWCLDLKRNVLVSSVSDPIHCTLSLCRLPLCAIDAVVGNVCSTVYVLCDEFVSRLFDVV